MYCCCRLEYICFYVSISLIFILFFYIGHPEGHIDNQNKEDDLLRLKEKVDAGADLIVTQLFFDVEVFIEFVKRCRNIGITCPILPGIFPIQSYGGLSRVISFNNNFVPQHIWDDLEPIKEDDQAVKDYGIDLAIKHIKKIKEETGINGFHIYTFNLERSSRLILEKLGLVPEQEQVKPLPWNPVSYNLNYFTYILIEFFIYIYSLLVLTVQRKLFVLSSGRTVPKVTSKEPNLGMSSLMVAGEMHVLLLLVNLADGV